MPYLSRFNSPLYELAGRTSTANQARWRTRFALAEKQLSHESTLKIRVDVTEFTEQGKVQRICAEIASLQPSRQQQWLLQCCCGFLQVPVFADAIHDSCKIAEYVHSHYPAALSTFHSKPGKL